MLGRPLAKASMDMVVVASLEASSFMRIDGEQKQA